MSPPAPVRPPCSTLSERDGESAYGTASPARFWVVLEQNGPWGELPNIQSRLDPQLGRRLEFRSARLGGRFQLIRSTAGHTYVPSDPVRFYLAWSGPGPWLMSGTLASPYLLREMDWDALARGDAAAVVAGLPQSRPAPPTLLVCTNGKRDVCCATIGRPVAAAAALDHPDRTWECSHTGGHRFAATALLLPYGQLFARLDEQLVCQILPAADAGHLPLALLGPRHDRGRSALPAVEQAAESAIRAHLGETALDAFVSLAAQDPQGPGSTTVHLGHRDGRRFRVELDRVPIQDRPGSCRAVAVPAFNWTTRIVELPPAGDDATSSDR